MIPHLILVGAMKGGVGKGEPLYAKISTPHGWKTMGDMQVGMHISGTDGKIYQVNGVYPRGILPTYRVTFTDGTFVDCDGDHIWTTKSIVNWRKQGWVDRTTAELMKLKLYNKTCQYYIYSIPIIEPVQYASSKMPMDAYTLGVLIGDGALTGNRVVFSVPDAKEGVRIKVAQRIGDDHQLRGPYHPESCAQWNISSKSYGRNAFLAEIKNLGLDCKSKERFIPEVYKTASVTDRLELLRGLMDTDGSATKGRTSFSTCSERLASDIADLVRSLGGIAIVHRYDRTAEEKSVEWNINVRMRICPFSLEYKAAGWVPASNDRGKYFKSIEPIGNLPIQCISTTAPNKLYITDGYNATHNTTVSRSILNYCAARSMEIRAYDTQVPDGVLRRYHPDVTSLIDLTTSDGHMQVFDTLKRSPVTLIDLAAGLLAPTLETMSQIGLLEALASGKIKLSVMHLIGSNPASFREIEEMAAVLAGAKHYLVLNHLNAGSFYAWDSESRKQLEMGSGTINIPKLDELAAEHVEKSDLSFTAFCESEDQSETLRGYVRYWLRQVYKAYDQKQVI